MGIWEWDIYDLNGLGIYDWNGWGFYDWNGWNGWPNSKHKHILLIFRNELEFWNDMSSMWSLRLPRPPIHAFPSNHFNSAIACYILLCSFVCMDIMELFSNVMVPSPTSIVKCCISIHISKIDTNPKHRYTVNFNSIQNLCPQLELVSLHIRHPCFRNLYIKPTSKISVTGDFGSHYVKWAMLTNY